MLRPALGLRRSPLRESRTTGRPSDRYHAAMLRKWRRVILNALTALSLLLFLAVVVMWVRSYRVADHLMHLSGRVDNYGIESEWGGIYFRWTRWDDPTVSNYWLAYSWPTT